MARIYPLFSSSKGNAAFLGTKDGGILIDAGVSLKRLRTAMERCGLPMEAVQAVFVTHDHADHIAGLPMLTKQYAVPVYAQAVTRENLFAKCCIAPERECRIMEKTVTVCGMQLTAFDTPHDTDRSCGYRITMPDGRICAVCTDLGHMPENVKQALTGCDLVLLEANYDEQMLRNGPYPDYLKARIASDRGHLSNSVSGQTARMLVQSGTTRIVLGHLSQENNRPDIAEETVTAALAGFVRRQDYLLETAPPETNGRMIAF